MFMSKPSTHIYGTLEYPILRGCAAFIKEGNKSRRTSPVKHFLTLRSGVIYIECRDESYMLHPPVSTTKEVPV